MQPTGQDRTIAEVHGALGQCHEHRLSHVLRDVRIANHAKRGRIYEINVTLHQLGEGRFGMLLRIGAQQLGIGLTVHSP